MSAVHEIDPCGRNPRRALDNIRALGSAARVRRWWYLPGHSSSTPLIHGGSGIASVPQELSDSLVARMKRSGIRGRTPITPRRIPRANPESFAEFSGNIGIRRPVRRQNPLAHISVECRPTPIRHTLHQPVFDRVDMHIVDMPCHVIVVAYLVFPKSPLPYGVLAFHIWPRSKALAPQSDYKPGLH